MDATKKTSLSAGQLIRAILLKSEDVTAITENVFPVYRKRADLPYILYGRRTLDPTQTKSKAADTVEIEIDCYTEDYDQGIELAEAVREALDHVEGEDGELSMHSCSMTDAGEMFEADAYVQSLVFNMKINTINK